MTDARERFEAHASVEAIRAELDQAYAENRHAQERIKWLTGLLLLRIDQIRNGAWPASLFTDNLLDGDTDD
jgi:hypothetical protein